MLQQYSQYLFKYMFMMIRCRFERSSNVRIIDLGNGDLKLESMAQLLATISIEYFKLS